MISHTLLLVYLILSTIGLGMGTMFWSRQGVDAFIKLMFGGSTILGFILTLKLLGVL